MEKPKKKKQVKKKYDKETTFHLKQLGKRLQQLRIKKGYTNYEIFAYDHDIGRAQYGSYESGRNIQFDTLLKLIKLHKISIKDFFSEGFD
jgi:transcriptional regulator with XRE-family HTH domain